MLDYNSHEFMRTISLESREKKAYKMNFKPYWSKNYYDFFGDDFCSNCLHNLLSVKTTRLISANNGFHLSMKH